MSFMNFEYYYLYSDPIYEDQSFIDEFSAQFDKVMPLHCTGLINLYNFGVAVRAKKEYYKTHVVKKGMSCNGIHNIDILPDGTFAICGFLNIYTSADDENIYDDNSSPMDVEKGCKFLKDFYATPHCDSNHCGNYQCRECTLYSVMHRDVHKQCNMRAVEREILERYV